ncbi:MAG: DinB family protein [Anaerolineales bacterium]|nr:DinB family protein [Anaerolineales bacterium]
MTMLRPPRFIRSLKKSPLILEALLQPVTQEQAQSAYDADWNVVAVVCHLRDFEAIFFRRCRMMLEQPDPLLPAYDHAQMAHDGNYNNQNLREVLSEFRQTRAEYVTWLEELPEADWQRTGTHPEVGPVTIMEVALQVALHDVDHIEQIAQMLHGDLR